MSDEKTGLTYAQAGVDIDAGNALVDRIKPAARATERRGTVELLGNPVRFSKTPVTYRRAPPTCGADTQDLLDELKARRRNTQ